MTNELTLKRTRGRPRSADTSKSASTVQALDRGLLLLRTLANADQATLTDLSQLTGMVPSTVHRLLITLQGQGLVDFDEERQFWGIGVEAFRIGSAFVRRTNVVAAGRPIMQSLMEATNETANLGITDDGDVVFISQVETREAIRAFFQPGTRGHMHASGIGKALMAHMPEAGVERIVARKGLPSFTHRTITTPEGLRADLKKTRERGWSVDDEERNVGMRCLAAPIFNAFGEPVAGVSISGPTSRLVDTRIEEFGPAVAKAAADITAAIGGVAPVTA